MADTKWTNANGGDWHTAGNWDNGVPTTANRAIVDAASFAANGKQITASALMQCAGLDVSAADQTFSLVSSVYSLEFYGNIVGSANCTITLTGIAYAYIKGNCNITQGGATLNLNRLYIDGAGITVTNLDAMVFSGHIYLTNGTWDTNGKNITGAANSSVFNLGIGTKTLITTSNTIWMSAFYFHTNTTGFTFTKGTSTLKSTSGGVSGAIGFINSVIQCYNVECVAFYSGTATYNNVTITGWGNIAANCNLTGNPTISNILTIAGANSTTQRVLIQSDTIGTPRNLTFDPAKAVISNCDFQDINSVNACDLSANTTVGNCGGNTGFTFCDALDLYIVHTSGAMSVSNAAKWKLADLTSAGRVPLPHDRSWGVAGSFTGASTVTMDCPRIGSLDLSGVNQAITWTLANAISGYGHYVLGNNITQNGAFIISLFGRSNYNINLFLNTVYRLLFNCKNGTYTAQSNLNATNDILVAFGILDLNAYNVTTRNFNGSRWVASGGDGFAYLRNGLITLTGISTDILHLLCNPGTSTIKLTANSGSANINLTIDSYYILWISGTHTGNYDLDISSTFAKIIIDPGRKVRVTAGTTQQVRELTMGVGATLTGVTAAQYTLNYIGNRIVQLAGVLISYANVTPINKWWADPSSNAGNNTGWRWGFYQKAFNYLNTTRVVSRIRGITPYITIVSALKKTVKGGTN
jgi:hypothetical protein